MRFIIMYYKINTNIMYRLYDNYGYITDNTMFGYRYMDDKTIYPGEEYVSFFTSINSDESFPGCILRPIGNKTPIKYLK